MGDELSIFGLIIGAGVVVQAIMLILVLMSIYSWTIIMSKKAILISVKKDIRVFTKSFHEDVAAVYQVTPNTNTDQTSIQRIFTAGYGELTHVESFTDENTMLDAERAYRAMNTQTNNEVDTLDKSLSVLAMIATSSPYIGLFGTVWGIMHSFIGLASVKQATITIVAPGIAEALIATAFGLFAAIPATIAYNRLSSQVGEISNQYAAFVERLFVIFQRQVTK